MAKRKNRFIKKGRAELLDELRYQIDEMTYWSDTICSYIKEWGGAEWFGSHERLWGFIKEHRELAMSLIDAIQERWDMEEPEEQPKPHKGKGKLNLHEKDRELELSEYHSIEEQL